VRIESVTVGSDTVDAVLRFEPGEALRTSEVPGIPEAILTELPGLRGHRCDNDAGVRFPEELRDTELAHLVEHAALEVMAMAGSPVTLRGATAWDFARDGRGVFRVRLAYDDDLVALGALRFACALVDALAHGESVPDADADAEAEARRLRELRKR
jgi:hypothetical protein